MGTSLFDRIVAKNARFQELTQSGSLPGETVLDSTNNISTQLEATLVTLTLTKSNLFITFAPGLWVHSPLDMNNTLLTGLFYSFADDRSCPGTLAIVTEDNSSAGFRARSTVERQLLRWFNDMTRGSRLSEPGYSPVTDSDPRGLLAELQSKLAPGPRGAVIPNLPVQNGKCTVTTINRISKSSGEGGVEIPTGSEITLSVWLKGTTAEIKAGTAKANSVRLKSNSLYLMYQGERALQILDLSVYNGGSIKVNQYAVLSDKLRQRQLDPSTQASARQLVAIVAAMASAGASTDEARFPATAGKLKFKPTEIEVAQNIVENCLAEAIDEIYQQCAANLQSAVPAGVDLDAIFGADCRETR